MRNLDSLRGGKNIRKWVSYHGKLRKQQWRKSLLPFWRRSRTLVWMFSSSFSVKSRSEADDGFVESKHGWCKRHLNAPQHVIKRFASLYFYMYCVPEVLPLDVDPILKEITKYERVTVRGIVCFHLSELLSSIERKIHFLFQAKQ